MVSSHVLRSQLLRRSKAAQNLGAEEAEVFEAHLTILADPEMIGQIENQIKNERSGCTSM